MVWLSLLSGEICEICALANGRSPVVTSGVLPRSKVMHTYFAVSATVSAEIALVWEVSFNLTASTAADKRLGEVEQVGRLDGARDKWMPGPNFCHFLNSYGVGRVRRLASPRPGVRQLNV